MEINTFKYMTMLAVVANCDTEDCWKSFIGSIKKDPSLQLQVLEDFANKYPTKIQNIRILEMINFLREHNTVSYKDLDDDAKTAFCLKFS